MRTGLLALFSLTLAVLFTACTPQSEVKHHVKQHPDDLTRLIDSVYLERYHAPVYYVIAGSLKDSAAASRFCRHLRKEGLPAGLLKSKTRWRVTAGTYKTHEQAVQFRNRYNTKNPGTGAWILMDTLDLP